MNDMLFQKRFSGKLLVWLLIFSLVGTTLYFPNFILPTPQAQAATYTFTQTSWSGGASSTTAVHPTDQTGLTIYSTSSDVTADADLQLTATTASTTDTSDADFNEGTNSTTTVSSGSVSLDTSVNFDDGDGSDGALDLTSSCSGTGISGTHPNCTITGATYNYTSVTIPSGVTTTVSGSTPLVIQATGDVTIEGVLYLKGLSNGSFVSHSDGGGGGGKYGGKGGGAGASGNDGAKGETIDDGGGGKGDGEELNNNNSRSTGGGGGGGHATVGGAGGDGFLVGGSAGTAIGDAQISTFTSSTVGGSGGGGSGGNDGANRVGVAGGGGGGAIKITTNGTITVSGAINADGGAGNNGGDYTGGGGGGAGGTIWLQGETLTLSGTTTAVGGGGGSAGSGTTAGGTSGGGDGGDNTDEATTGGGSGGGGSHGRVRLDYDSTFTGTSTPGAGYTVCSSGCNDTPPIAYQSSGVYTSTSTDLGQASDLTTLEWTATVPASTTLTLDMRAGNTAVPDGSWTSWQTSVGSGASSSSSIPAALDGYRYVQYRANLSTTDTSATPSLDSLAIHYQYYSASGSLTSAKYDTSSDANVMGGLNWYEDSTKPTSTQMELALRTASSSDALDSATWYGLTSTSTDCSKSSDNVSCTSAALNAALTDGSNDQWWQYRVTLSGNGAYTPTASSVEVVYVVNAAPNFNTATSTQISNSGDSDWGKVSITYSVRDTDTDEGATAFSILPSFEYSTSSGATWNTISSFDEGATATSSKTVATSSYNTYVVTWNNVSSTLSNFYSTTTQVRVTADDSEAANNEGYATTTVTIDTSPPTFTSSTLLIDSSSSSVNTTTSTLTLSLQTISGNANSETIYVEFATSSTWYGANANGTLASAGSLGTGFSVASSSGISWPWTMDNRSETISLRVRDAYNNVATGTETNAASYNATPEFDATFGTNGISVNQISTSTDSNWGDVQVQYRVRDTDTALGENTPNKASTTLQYRLTSGAGWTTIATSTITGATSTIDIGATYSTFTSYWDVNTTIDETYSTTTEIRVTVDDAEPVLNSTSSDSAAFTIDTKAPTGGTMTFDAGVAGTTDSATVSTTPATDDSQVQYQLTDDSTTHSSATSTGWVNISSATSTSWTFDSDIEKKVLDVQFRDIFGNLLSTSTVSTTDALSADAFLVQDVSNVNVSPKEYELYIAWEASTSTVFSSYALEYATSSDNTTFGSFADVTTITTTSTNSYVHESLDTNTYYKYRVGVNDTNGNTTVRSTAGITAKPDGVQNLDEGGGGTSAQAGRVENVVPSQASNGNVTVNYQITDTSTSTKTSPSYEAYLFYDLGVTLPSSAYDSGAGTLTVSDAGAMATSGYVQVNQEVLSYTGKSGNALSGVTRGTWPTEASSGRATRQNSDFFEGTPVWIKATSTTPVTLTSTSSIDTGQSATITWNTGYEEMLAGSSYTNVGIRPLVHDDQGASSGPLSSQNDLTDDGLLGTLDMTAPTIQFSTTTSSAAENSGTSTVSIILSKPYPLNATVTYSISASSTATSTDYSVPGSSATVSARATSTTFDVGIVDDSTSEADETIIFTLSGPSNASLGSNTTHTFTITDDETEPTLGFSTSTSSGSEGTATATLTLVLSEAAGQDITVDYAVAASSTATGSGTDYTLSDGTATISAGATTTSITATIVDDAVDESDETIVVTLSNASGASLSATTTHTYTILDNEGVPEIYFEISTSTGAESVTSTSFTVVISETSGLNASVNYAVSASSTATGGGEDYTLGAGTATVTAGATSTTISATITDDSTNEPNETLVITLSSPTNATLGATTTHTYTITDDDNSAPDFESATSTQISDSGDSDWGKVSITYSVRDTDTHLGTPTSTQEVITPSFEYNVGAGWVDVSTSTLASGDVDTKTVSSTAYNSYTATWDVASQLSDSYSASAQIRVTADDSQVGNNTGSTTTAPFELDAKKPTVTFTVDSSDDVLSIVLTEDTSSEWRASNSSTLVSDGTNASSSIWQSFSATSTTATTTWTLTGAPSSEIVYLETRDAYGNVTTSTAVAPATPTNLRIRDVSDPANTNYREFLTWDVYASTASATFSAYEVRRSTDDSSYSTITSITDINSNSYTDTSVSSTDTYYYKLRILDTDGDRSNYATSTASDQPDGQGGTDVTAPTISSINISASSTSWATITWTTNEVATSSIEFSEATTTPTFASSSVKNTFTTSHSVTITGLTASTSYAYRVRSTDALGNEGTSDNGGSGYEFTTAGGPAISNVQVTETTDTSAVITWTTDEAANSVVDYSQVSDLSSSVSTVGAGSGVVSGPPYQHRVTVSGLTQGLTYYFRVESTDADGLETVDNNGGNFYSFRTGYDTKAPVISSINTPVITANAVVITWETDEPATSKIEYGTSSAATGAYASSTDRDNTLTRTHVVTVSGLTPVTKYYYRVQSYDFNVDSPTAVSDEQEVTTASEKEVVTITQTIVSGGGGATTDTVAPSVSTIKVDGITAFGATITFDTSEAATGFILYGRDTSYGRTGASSELKTSHTVRLSGLQLGTTYHFKVRAQDKAGNFGESSDQTFVTKFAAEALDELVSLENASQFQEELENIIESTLPSLVPPHVANVEVEALTETSAVLSWNTNVPAFSLLGYAPESQYDASQKNPYITEVGQSELKVRQHRIELTGLSPATLYHFQARSFSIPGVIGKSNDMTFITKASKIKPEVVRLGNTEAEIRWITTVETSSFVEYRDLNSGRVGRAGDDTRVRTHSILLENLTPDTPYQVRVFGTDERNTLVEGDPLRIRTKKDVVAPVISNIRIDSALLPGRTDRLQSVISWRTDEPANSILYFEEGVGIETELDNVVGQENVFTMDHTVIVTTFRPATVYRIQVASTDESGNTVSSPVRTILTPRSAESVFDVVIQNFQETFGFLNQLRQ